MKKALLLLTCLFSLCSWCYSQAGTEESSNLFWDTLAYPVPEYGWSEGMTVPNVVIRDVNNKEYRLYDLLDKPLVIDFWFIACKPCIANKKYLKRFYLQYPIEILSISIDERASTVKRYAEDNGMHWLNVHDNSPYSDRFKLQIGSDQSYPLYLLIDEEGKVLGTYEGGASIARLGVLLQVVYD
ncbi:MAG: TlpA disulfide reductase family protein [Bacteroidota bacterium]